MALTLSSAGLVSLLMLPGIFVLIIRLMGSSYDLTDIVLRLIIAEAISLIISVFIVAHFKLRARVPIPD